MPVGPTNFAEQTRPSPTAPGGLAPPSQEPPGTGQMREPASGATEEHAPQPTTAPAEPREYIMLQAVDTNDDAEIDTWREVGREKAQTKGEARDLAYDKLPEDERTGPFVTIAASAWKPQTAAEQRDVKPGVTTIRRVWS